MYHSVRTFALAVKVRKRHNRFDLEQEADARWENFIAGDQGSPQS